MCSEVTRPSVPDHPKQTMGGMTILFFTVCFLNL
jgi:hypothetical protein